MAQLEVRFIHGVVWKTLILGVVAVVVSGLWLGSAMAVSVLSGTVVAALNLRFVAWLSQKMIGRAKKGNTNSTAWAMLLLVKMFVLFGLIFVLIALLDVDAIGFVTGFSLFLPAIAWQAALGGSDGTQDSEEDPQP